MRECFVALLAHLSDDALEELLECVIRILSSIYDLLDQILLEIGLAYFRVALVEKLH